VDDLTLTIPEGSIHGFIGPNGSGKTTTMWMVVGILHPDHGSIRVSGDEMTGVPSGKIGYLPEERGLYRKMRLRALLEFHGQTGGEEQRAASGGGDGLDGAVGGGRVDRLPSPAAPLRGRRAWFLVAGDEVSAVRKRLRSNPVMIV
jgi:energy-coupling factor transporter ATP-binding protein EcfA2